MVRIVQPLLVLLLSVVLYGAYNQFYASPIHPCVPEPLPPLPEAVGVSAPNDVLAAARHFHEGHYSSGHFGPESFAYDGKRWLYSGVANGKIIKFDLLSKNLDLFEVGSIRKDLGEACVPGEMERECGRPLGLEYHRDGYLIVADAYGLVKFDVTTGESTMLADGINGREFGFLNTCVLSKDDVVYFVESTSKWKRHEVPQMVFESCPDGTLYSYDLKTDKLDILQEGLTFPNGVALTPNEDAVVFSETMRARLNKFYLAGPQKGKLVRFSENLPGRPDNLRYDAELELYWVGLSSKRMAPFSTVDYLIDKPMLRIVLAALFPQKLAYHLLPKMGIIAAVGLDGDILFTLQDPSGGTNRISEAFRVGSSLYLGSYDRESLAVLPMEEVRKHRATTESA